MRRDVISAYCAAAAKIGSWVIVLGLLYRSDKTQFAILALVRGTIGILNYTTFGLSPAMISMLAERRNDSTPDESPSAVHSYATASATMPGELAYLSSNGHRIA